jgi:phytanoyl-CoA hydroxylase
VKESLSDLMPGLREDWHNNGFVILNGIFPDSQIDAVNNLVDSLWNHPSHVDAPVTIDVRLESNTQRRILLRDATPDMRQSPYKINDLYLEFDLVRRTALDARLCRVLTELLDGSPLLCNSLNFEYGSQQRDHVDSFYMPSRKPNGMLATWIALEDISLDSGPVHYYPGSHKIPPYLFSHGRTNAIAAEMPLCQRYFESQLQERGLHATPFLARKGDVLIWHSQLLHGGRPIVGSSGITRKSLACHYFRRRDYLHHLWRLRRCHENGYFYRRRHQAVA